MPQISRSALVPFSAEQMYQLVNDVHSYPDFLPGCTGSRVINASNNEMTAAVDVAKAGISKTFTTRNTLLDNQSINMQLVDGPFRKLMGGWHFTPLSVASSHVVCDPTRTRKLLLNKRELDSLFGRVNREGYTVVALSMYWKNAWVKVKIGVAKGKKEHDKRDDIKDREWQTAKARIMKHANR